MGMPREISADGNGLLLVEPCREFLDSTFRRGLQVSIPSTTLALSSVACMRKCSLPVQEAADYCLEFLIKSQDAASFGLMLRTDGDMKGHRLRFVPAAVGLFDMCLLSCPPPLDDFWADQYGLHLPREVDGPEIARHAALPLHGSIVVAVRCDVVL